MIINYVTAFLNLNRENWKYFSRSVNEYINNFLPFVNLIKNSKNILTVYIDENIFQEIKNICKDVNNIQIFKIDREFLKIISPLWRRVKREKEIMETKIHLSRINHRIRCPETHNPEYTLINHCKIDFMAYTTLFSNFEYFCWVDFGFFAKKENIPNSLNMDVKKINTNKIVYTTINPIDEKDKDIFYTLKYAPEKIGGFFFFGNRKNILKYAELYRNQHSLLQNQNIVDDDQHIALRCYFENPELFEFYNLGWHKALVYFCD